MPGKVIARPASLVMYLVLTPAPQLHSCQDTESATLSAQLYQALVPSLRLDLLPKSAIDLFVTVLECDGPLDDISW